MFVYRILISLALPLFAAFFVLRWVRGREDAAALRARISPLAPSDRPTIWLHAASNGELTSARPLIDALLRQSDCALRLTVNSVTARDLGRGWALPRTQIALAPLDLRWLAAASLRRARVALFVSLENELWPNRLRAAHDAQVPVALVAARLSERSAKGWTRLPGLAQAALGEVKLLSAQDSASQARLVALGVPQQAVAPPLDLKALYDRPPQNPDPAFDRARTLLFASTHEGEDAILLDALARIRVEQPDIRAVLAPRHPPRAAAIAALARARGFNPELRSENGDPSTDLYIADTLGEMARWYDSAAVTFVAGSLTDRGGHTPHEPAAHGSAVVHGADVRNFTAAYATLREVDGAMEASTPQDIAAAMLAALDDPERPARARAALASDTDVDALTARLTSLIL